MGTRAVVGVNGPGRAAVGPVCGVGDGEACGADGGRDRQRGWVAALSGNSTGHWSRCPRPAGARRVYFWTVAVVNAMTNMCI